MREVGRLEGRLHYTDFSPNLSSRQNQSFSC